MKTTSNYLIILFSVMLFIFRLVVVFTTTMGIEFIIKTDNVNLEIGLLFIMLLSVILISKNKLSGAILFLISSFGCYGPGLIKNLHNGMNNPDALLEVVISFVCLLVPIFAFFIIAAAKKQEIKPVDAKTDFFYKNEAYDRKYDDRADKNNYRTL